MEYCSGGSLYAMLDKPKYAFGFPEEEFLIVLQDISNYYIYLHLRFQYTTMPAKLWTKE